MASQLRAGFDYQASNSGFNSASYHIFRALVDVHTSLPCKVVECFPLAPGNARTNKDGISGLVHVDLQIDQMDNQQPPECANPDGPIRIYNVPYFRLQAGICAVVVDPLPGDFGFLQFAERDISKWKKTRERGMPASNRLLSQSDCWYIGGTLNDPPKIWIRLREDGIFIEANDQPVTVRTDSDIAMKAGGDISMTAGGKVDITAGGDVNVKGANINLN
jgi:hypothetical protein